MDILFKNIDEIDSADIKKAVEVNSDVSTVFNDESTLNAESTSNNTDVNKSIRQKKKLYNQV